MGEGGTRLTHELRLVDEGSPTRRGKPPGVSGAEVWVKLIEAGQPAPTDPAVLSFLKLTSRPTVRTEFRAADGGKTAVYMLRWVNTRGEKGPWSEICDGDGGGVGIRFLCDLRLQSLGLIEVAEATALLFWANGLAECRQLLAGLQVRLVLA